MACRQRIKRIGRDSTTRTSKIKIKLAVGLLFFRCPLLPGPPHDTMVDERFQLLYACPVLLDTYIIGERLLN